MVRSENKRIDAYGDDADDYGTDLCPMPRDDAASQQDTSTPFSVLIEFEATEYSYSIRFVFEILIRFVFEISNRFDSIRFDSIRFDSIRFDSIRFDSIRFDVCVCACVRACVRACVCMCARVRVCVSV